MTDTTIKCFLSVCDTLNFTRSAEAMFMTQQAVSKQIGSLETELGCQLFIRERRSLSITEAGELFRRMFRRWASELDYARGAAARMTEEYSHIISIGYLSRLSLPRSFHELIYDFKQEHPAVSIEYSQTDVLSMSRLLLGGEIDFCIAHDFLFQDDNDLECMELLETHKHIAISKRHPLYSEPFDVSKLDRAVCLYAINEDQDDETEQRNILAQFSAIGVKPASMKALRNYEVLELAVEMGEGVTLSSDVNALSHRDDIHTIDTGSGAMLSIGWNRNNRRPVVELLKKELISRLK